MRTSTIFQVGLLNVDGYYNSLLSFIDKAVEEGFISPNARQIIVSAPTTKVLVKKLEVIYICVCLEGIDYVLSLEFVPPFLASNMESLLSSLSFCVSMEKLFL